MAEGTAGLVLVVLAIYMSVFALNLYGYKEYAQEVSVATVSFRESGDQSFIATVTRTDGSAEDFRLKGDQWQLDARIIKWKMPFSLLGLKPGYQLIGFRAAIMPLKMSAPVTVPFTACIVTRWSRCLVAGKGRLEPDYRCTLR